jgi:hypothetical protein
MFARNPDRPRSGPASGPASGRSRTPRRPLAQAKRPELAQRSRPVRPSGYLAHPGRAPGPARRPQRIPPVLLARSRVRGWRLPRLLDRRLDRRPQGIRRSLLRPAGDQRHRPGSTKSRSCSAMARCHWLLLRPPSRRSRPGLIRLGVAGPSGRPSTGVWSVLPALVPGLPNGPGQTDPFGPRPAPRTQRPPRRRLTRPGRLPWLHRRSGRWSLPTPSSCSPWALSPAALPVGPPTGPRLSFVAGWRAPAAGRLLVTIWRTATGGRTAGRRTSGRRALGIGALRGPIPGRAVAARRAGLVWRRLGRRTRLRLGPLPRRGTRRRRPRRCP